MQDACDDIKNKNKNTEMWKMVLQIPLYLSMVPDRSVDTPRLMVVLLSYLWKTVTLSTPRRLSDIVEAARLLKTFAFQTRARCDLWKAIHLCLKSHSGSAGAMEVSGAGRLFLGVYVKNEIW